MSAVDSAISLCDRFDRTAGGRSADISGTEQRQADFSARKLLAETVLSKSRALQFG